MMMPLQWAFVAGGAVGGGLGVLLGQWLAWWFLFPVYRRLWQPRTKRRNWRRVWS